MMKIQVGGLSEGVHEYSFRSTPADVGLPPEFKNEVDVQATLEKSSGQLFLRARVSTSAEVACDRCVTLFQQPLQSKYQMYYLWEEPEEDRYDPSEVQVLTPGQTVLDLTDDVRQTVLLSLPLKHVCREECKGLCPLCGKNLNEGSCNCTETHEDGRWDKLKELQNNKLNQAG
ncbi:MAG TPA: DUF177 domain-containing protein [Bacteroidota bacterium]|nr:DUF177 domain-containing protein [Bacteroidota bacterium]